MTQGRLPSTPAPFPNYASPLLSFFFTFLASAPFVLLLVPQSLEGFPASLAFSEASLRHTPSSTSSGVTHQGTELPPHQSIVSLSRAGSGHPSLRWASRPGTFANSTMRNLHVF